MDRDFQTSFIPKKKAETRSAISKVKRPMTIYSWVAVIIFVIALILAVGGFFYQRYLISQNDEKKTLIQNEISSFDPELTETLSSIKSRVDSGNEILGKHLSVSRFLDALESITVGSIFLETLSLSAVLRDNIEITVGGKASSYMALAYQSDVLREADFIKNLDFSDVNLDEEGNVVFSFSAGLDPEVILYENNIVVTPVSEIENQNEENLEEDEEVSETQENSNEENENQQN